MGDVSDVFFFKNLIHRTLPSLLHTTANLPPLKNVTPYPPSHNSRHTLPPT